MISLDVKEYCSECPDFKADLEKISYYDGDDLAHTDTIIRCKYYERCERIKEYLEKGE